MSRRNRTHSSYSPCSGRRAVALLALACALTWPSASRAQLDICGCAGAPGLGAFDTADSSSYPPGTTIDGYFITIQLPDDGVLIFDSLSVGLNSSGGWSGVRFAGNAANTPVTLLVKGDVTITSLSTLSVEGEPGTYGTAGGAGIGGLGGPGGFAGGDGAFQAVNLVSDGATGFGPGGGAGGIASPLANGADATFFGVPTLLPPVGGSGGGGGASSDSGVFCAGSGGGGGGGAILVAANGTITLDGTLNAWGGSAGGVPSGRWPHLRQRRCDSPGSVYQHPRAQPHYAGSVALPGTRAADEPTHTDRGLHRGQRRDAIIGQRRAAFGAAAGCLRRRGRHSRGTRGGDFRPGDVGSAERDDRRGDGEAAPRRHARCREHPARPGELRPQATFETP